MNPSEKIRLIREVKNISQEAIAYELGLSQKSYSRLETNETALKVDQLVKIAKILDVAPEMLVESGGLTIKIETQGDKNINSNHGTINHYGLQEESLERLTSLEKRVNDLQSSIKPTELE